MQQGAVAVDAVQVDLVSGDAMEQKTFDVVEAQPVEAVQAMAGTNGGADSARFNAAVNAFAVQQDVVQQDVVHQVETEPVAPNVVASDFKEMTEDVSNAEVNGGGDAGHGMVDLLNMDTMDDGGKIEDAKVDDVVQGMEELNVAEHDSDNDVVAPMMSAATVQGDEPHSEVVAQSASDEQ